MLTKNIQRLVLASGLALILIYVASTYYRYALSQHGIVSHAGASVDGAKSPLGAPGSHGDSQSSEKGSNGQGNGQGNPSQESQASLPAGGADEELNVPPTIPSHLQIDSSSSRSGKYLSIDFGGIDVLNPNVIPHPERANAWTVVALQKRREGSVVSEELVCDAVIRDDAMRCEALPTVLPVAATRGGNCHGKLSHFNLNVGPNDGRVFFGPQSPYIVFGSNSLFTCFGQFAQGFSGLAGWGGDSLPSAAFSNATELQRPPPWSEIEKNWFLFWDDKGDMYVHHDVQPQRAFARVQPDGSVGPDLGSHVALRDQKCLRRYMPKPAPPSESIHQATNSLKVTMCRRADPACVPNHDNTFIFAIYQHKTYYDFHSVYEPYVMMFKQQAPFEVHAMSQKPLWINGREIHPEKNTSDMFYVTSMSWKSHDRTYSGFLDDELFIAFGIEDHRAGVVDVAAHVVLGDLGMCHDLN